jgi:hypothetical protein
MNIQPAAIAELEYVLQKLSRKGLIDFLTISCYVEYDMGMERMPLGGLIYWCLDASYGKEAVNAYLAGKDHTHE